MKKMRTSKDEWFLDEAERCARQGTCLRRVYGAIVVDSEETIITTGYVGAPRKTRDCLRRGKCWRKAHRIPSGSNYEKCRSVHAETNALLQAGKLARGSTLYLVGLDAETGKLIDAHPCAMCARLILNAQISMVVMRRHDGSIIKREPSYLNALWDGEVFDNMSVDWSHLCFASQISE